MRPRPCKVNVDGRYSMNRHLHFSVPQASLCGPVLYSAYASTVQEVIPPPLDINSFVDDHSLKDNFKVSSREDELHTIRNLENCTKDVKV